MSAPSTVPSRVKNIHVSNSGDSSSLKVSWTPGPGDVDGYSVFLYRQSRQLDARPVLKHHNEVTFGSLQPGQMYSVMIQSVSGELLNNNTASGRTGQQVLHDVILTNRSDSQRKHQFTVCESCSYQSLRHKSELLLLHIHVITTRVCLFSALNSDRSPGGGPRLYLQPAGELAGCSGCV